MDRVPELTEYTYRCQYCGMECVKKAMPWSGLGPTKLGNYGGNATPTPTTYVEEMYETGSISFTAESGDDAAYLSDSKCLFGENLLRGGMAIRIATDSGTNDGDYTVAVRGLSRCTLTLSDDDSLTTEDAATAGTVTISRIIYQPNVGTGCGFCGSLNSK